MKQPFGKQPLGKQWKSGFKNQQRSGNGTLRNANPSQKHAVTETNSKWDVIGDWTSRKQITNDNDKCNHTNYYSECKWSKYPQSTGKDYQTIYEWKSKTNNKLLNIATLD